MECKFKQITRLDEACNIPLGSSQIAVNEAINYLLTNVSNRVFNKKAIQKSKTFLKNKIISLEVDTINQIYQVRPNIPSLTKEEQSPRKGMADCMRPMSAKILHFKGDHRRSITNQQSRKTFESHVASFTTILRQKRKNSAAKSTIENKSNSNRKLHTKTHENQKKFFAVMSTYEEDDLNAEFIDELRMKKKLQENEVKKKQQFLKSIQMDSTIYSAAQNKFIQSISRKKFIYGPQGEVIQINGASQKLHLKKISAMSKSRVGIKSKKNEDFKNSQEQLKENIYVELKGRGFYQSRPKTSKPNNRQKTQQSQDHNQSNKIFSMRQTKKQTEPNKACDKIQETKLGQKIPIGREIVRSSQTDNGGLIKKKVQRIFFYPSSNSIYRVINQGTPVQTNHVVTVQEI